MCIIALVDDLIKFIVRLVLLEAQAATGNMVDPFTGEHMSVVQAVKRGLIDDKYEEALSRAEKAVTGFEDPVTRKTLSLYECMKKGYIVEGHGIRYCTNAAQNCSSLAHSIELWSKNFGNDLLTFFSSHN